MAKYRLILFDFDGTLADTLPWFQSAFHVIGGKYGFKKLDPAEYEKLRDYDSKQILKALGVPFWKVPLIAKDMMSLMAQHIREAKLFPDTHMLLQTLSSRGLTLGIVSSNSEENIRHVLGQEITARILFYECGVSMFGKAAKLKKVLRQSRTAPDQALYIGDELRDLQAAKAAGIPFGAVSWGYNRAEALQRQVPTEMFCSMAEIVKRLA
ncbi:MAG: HAD-superfamily hydrolase, subfamily variant 1 family protein 2 [Verrucomicrobiales bacterium]|nr:HAD-superfamily hydrolase, subfamily variant 1 family protein 2 [Verrucomicrobiales bacterium]